MEQTREAIQNEIEAAQKKRSDYLRRFLNGEHNNPDVRDNLVSTDGYIQGLQTAVRLLEKQQVQELPY